LFCDAKIGETVKRKRIILIVGLTLLATGMILLYPSHEPPIKIIGNLPPNDVRDIKYFVRHEIRQVIFHDVSWKGMDFLPADIRHYSRLKLKSMELKANGVVEVIVSLGTETKSHTNDVEAYYQLAKGPAGWSKRGTTYVNWPRN
jgi:hypothetical protein